MGKDKTQISTKITKVTLVIYCCIVGTMLIGLSIVSTMIKDFSLLYGFLLCLGPGIIFVLVSVLLPIHKLVEAKVGKAFIVWFIIGYILKYAAIIGIPFVGIKFSDLFNKWVMLATTLVAPITVIISKIIFANVVSKNSKTEQK